MAVNISEALVRDLQAAATQQGIDVNEFVETALEKSLADYREEQLAVEADYWYALPAEERNKYSDKFVAIYQRQIIDNDLDRVELGQRVRKKYGRVPIMITAGGDHPIPTYYIRSPRLVRLNDGR